MRNLPVTSWLLRGLPAVLLVAALLAVSGCACHSNWFRRCAPPSVAASPS